MKFNKTLVAVAASSALLLGLAACSSGATEEGGGEEEAGGEAGGLISIIVNDPSNPYWKAEGDVAQKIAEELGYEANVGAHEGDTNTENTLIDTAISNQSAAES